MSGPNEKSVAVIPDLRSFRESLVPARTLGQVARGAQMDKSLLSKIEIGKKEISALCAGRLARFYSRVTGGCVTAGQVLDMAAQAAVRRRGRF